MDEHNTPLNYIPVGEKNYLENLIALCPDGIIAIDRSGLIILFNRAAEVLTGRKANTVVGKMNIADIYPSPDVAKKVKRLIYADTHGGVGKIEDYEVDVRTLKGRKVPIRLSAALIYDDGVEVGSVGFFHDLTSRKMMEDTLHHLSITDSLTELFNQRYFYQCLSRELTRSQRYGRPLSIICFDLDNFKLCNDLLGHLEGDDILRKIGAMLNQKIRESDMAFRYGGDEFFVLLPESVLKSAEVTGEKIRKTFNRRWSYEKQYRDTRIPQVTLSMGIAQALADEKAESLIKRVDLAMYEAKRQGGDRIKIAADSIVKPQG